MKVNCEVDLHSGVIAAGTQASEYIQETNPGKTWQGGQQSEEVGQEWVTLLLACAKAVSTKSLSLLNHLLQKLGELASPKGTSIQRIAAYYTEGLACRIIRLWPQIYQKLPLISTILKIWLAIDPATKTKQRNKERQKGKRIGKY
jgi:hypothetical protein